MWGAGAARVLTLVVALTVFAACSPGGDGQPAPPAGKPAPSGGAPAAPAAAPTSPPAGGAAGTRATVRLGHNKAWGNPALLIGLHQGYFERAGIEVVQEEFANPADIVQAIATGDLDMGASTPGVLFTAAGQGVRAKAVALLQGSHHPSTAFAVRADSDVQSVRDLRGKRAGVGGFGGTVDLYLRYWLSREGLDPANDLEIVFVPFAQLLPALINRQVDVGAVDSIQQALAQQQYPGQLRKLFTFEDVARSAYGNTQTNALVLVFGDAFVQRDRAAAVRFLEAYVRATRDMNANPEKAKGDWAEASGIALIRQVEAPVTVPDDGKIYLDALQFEADQAQRFGYLQQPLDVARVVDHSLIDEAAARLR